MNLSSAVVVAVEVDIFVDYAGLEDTSIVVDLVEVVAVAAEADNVVDFVELEDTSIAVVVGAGFVFQESTKMIDH